MKITLKNLREIQIKFFPHEDFEKPEMEDIIMGVMPDQENYDKKKIEVQKAKSKVENSHFRPMYEKPLLNHKQERHLFKKMNYCKYRAKKLINDNEPSNKLLKEVENWLDKAAEIANFITEANLRLANQLLKKTPKNDSVVEEILSDGYADVFNAVHNFDFNFGTKFSTYCTWALFKNYGRHRQKEVTYYDRFPSGDENLLNEIPANELEIETSEQINKKIINKLFNLLKRKHKATANRQIKILCAAFGVNDEKQTLTELGPKLGISKERVRQIKVKGLQTLKELAEEFYEPESKNSSYF